MIWTALALYAICAWCSIGYNHPDEHYQLLEFANYKLGLSSAHDLPWEFAKHCRTSVQPFLAWAFCRALLALGFFNPVIAAFLLRLAMGVLSWWVVTRLVVRLLPGFKSATGRNWFVGATYFLWFIPYLSVRFSAENLSASLFFLAVSLLLDTQDARPVTKVLRPVAVGFLLGFVFFIRVQMVFGMGGLGIWLLFYHKATLRQWGMMIAGAALAMALSVCADHWMYGEWLFTPYTYFHMNLVQHVAEKWGVFPWYYYVVTFVQMAIPPISILLAAFFLLGLRKRLSNVFVLVTVIFLLGHFAIGHKEMRFLYPIVFSFVYLAALGLDDWLDGRTLRPWILVTARIVAGLNILLLAYRILAPAQEAMLYFGFLRQYSGAHPSQIVYWGRSPYALSGLEANFYKRPAPGLVRTETIFEFDSVVRHTPPGKDLLFLSRNIKPEPEATGYRLEKLYCIYPDWLLRCNIGEWEDRSNIWTIYRISPGGVPPLSRTFN